MNIFQFCTTKCCLKLSNEFTWLTNNFISHVTYADSAGFSSKEPNSIFVAKTHFHNYYGDSPKVFTTRGAFANVPRSTCRASGAEECSGTS
jgi:hypothetical protein